MIVSMITGDSLQYCKTFVSHREIHADAKSEVVDHGPGKSRQIKPMALKLWLLGIHMINLWPCIMREPDKGTAGTNPDGSLKVICGVSPLDGEQARRGGGFRAQHAPRKRECRDALTIPARDHLRGRHAGDKHLTQKAGRGVSSEGRSTYTT
jgi:hypothetical protein